MKQGREQLGKLAALKALGVGDGFHPRRRDVALQRQQQALEFGRQPCGGHGLRQPVAREGVIGTEDLAAQAGFELHPLTDAGPQQPLLGFRQRVLWFVASRERLGVP